MFCPPFWDFFFCFTCGINSSFFITFFSETNYCHLYMLEPFLLLKHILLIQASLYFMGMCIFPLKWDSSPNWVSSFCRNVTDADILALERRLLQTMDMIVSKKKRWEGSSSMKLFISSVFSQYGIRWFLKLQKLLVLLGLHVPVNRSLNWLSLCGVSFWPDTQLCFFPQTRGLNNTLSYCSGTD